MAKGSEERAAGRQPWRVAPRSGFVVDDPRGEVRITQIDDRHFLVLNGFQYSDAGIEADLVEKVQRQGSTAAQAREAVDRARTFSPGVDNPTDLASIPRFLRWFENPYGLHSLAALLHDELIVDDANGGALGSDSLADRFFREMMRTSGVPFFKRWIMWAGVALRTRWAAGGWRRWSILGWLLLSVLGIAGFVWSVGALAVGWALPLIPPGALLALALVLIVAAAPLWGRQWGAALIAAVAGFWVVPATLVAGAAWCVYLVLEWLAGRFGWT